MEVGNLNFTTESMDGQFVARARHVRQNGVRPSPPAPSAEPRLIDAE